MGGVVWVWNMIQSMKRPITAGPNPWGGYTLEWATESPAPAYDFAVDFPKSFLTERPLYDWEKNDMRLTPVNVADIHLPQSTIWPFATALSLLFMDYGLSYGWFNWHWSPTPATAPLMFPSIILWLSIPAFLYSIFKWAGTREYAVPVEHHTLTKYNNGFMGMAWFIISEVTLFGVLLSGYIYLRIIGAATPPASRPAIALAALNTLILVASSFVVHRAEQDLHHHRYSKGRLGLLVTLFLGALFMVFQIFEFSKFGQESNWTQNLWQSCFFIIVGLHGLHILIGGVGVALPYYQYMTGKIDRTNHGSLAPASMYWHLVDVVWLLIVALFYAW